jgi:hypothetical protein
MVGRFWYVDEDSLRKYQAESFKANQTSFRSTNSVTSPVANFIPNLVPKPMVTSGSVSTISGHSFILPVYKQIFFVVAVMIAVLAGGTAAISISKPFLPQAFSQNLSQTLSDNTASAYSAMSSVGGIMTTAFDKYYSIIASIFSPSKPLSSIALSNSSGGMNQGGNYSVASAGLVVVPKSASTTSANDAKLAQTIRNSFSDNVTVTPGTNGTTGIITPEFRTVAGHDFLYVLVPVKTTSTPNGSQ